MAAGSSERSNLIDITYGQLHQYLSGGLEGTSSTQVVGFLTPRVKQLKCLRDPFGKPSEASRKRIQSGSVTLDDGVVFRVEDADKEFIVAISEAFRIDEVNAFILLRSFMYNQGLPSSQPNESLVEACVEAITPFYLSERLSVFRILIPLFRAKEDPTDPAFEISTSFLPEIIFDGPQFVELLLTEYTRKTRDGFDKALVKGARSAYQWARQDLKEQLVLLEVLFWTMWGSVSCSGPLVEKIMSTAFATNLGTLHADSAIFFDGEAQRIEQDIAVLWNLITIEILELETLSDPDALQLSDTPSRPDLYIASPTSLQNIHATILANDGSQFVCAHLGWAYVLTRLTAVASDMPHTPPSYGAFLKSLGGNRPIHIAILENCLRPENGLLNILSRMLTASPFFVTMFAFKADSSLTDTNVIAFRSVFKGLLIALLDMTSPESLPDFNGLVDVWVTLFGRSESSAVAAICRQYWEFDWQYSASRRAIFDVARSRFPIQVCSLLRLARAMTGTGFLDTDPLCASDDTRDVHGLSDDRRACDDYVFDFFNTLPTYSSIIQVQACLGAHAIYERVQDRSSSSAVGHMYTNLRPVQLPGGSVLPVGSVGRALNSEGGEFMAICWSHRHSGWGLMLHLLTEYVSRRSLYPGSRRKPATNTERTATLVLSLEDAGVNMDGGVDEGLVTDILDLVRSVIQDNPEQAERLMESLEVPGMATSNSPSPDLVQLTMTILEDTFSAVTSRSIKSALPTPLVTSALSVLSAVLAIPHFSQRVWIYLKSTPVLFGRGKATGSASAALHAERAAGRYNVTLSVLHLVQKLFDDATALTIPEDLQVKKLKVEVLLTAVRFVHSEIWVEHLGWRYANVGDRFDIGRRIATFFANVLEHTPEDVKQGPFPELSAAVLDLFLFRASHSTVNPLVQSIAAGRQMIRSLGQAQRKADIRRVILLLDSELRLTRLLLNRKQYMPASNGRLCLLEQMICSHTSQNSVADPSQSRADAVDVLSSYVTERDVGAIVPLEAIRVLSSLCRSLPNATSAPAIAGHLSNAEATAYAFMRIVQHPYEDVLLRHAVWTFICLAVDSEPALAQIFVSGRLHAVNGATSQHQQKGKEVVQRSSALTVLDVAKDALEGWEGLWEHNPQLLSAVTYFLDVTWQHALEHKAKIDILRQESAFWSRVSSLACMDLGPVPELDGEEIVLLDNVRHSSMHEAVSAHCYRTAAKGHALHLIGLDIGQTTRMESRSTQSESFKSIESCIRREDELMDLLSEAVVSSYQPTLFDDLEEILRDRCKGLLISQFQVQDPLSDREYGDRFSLSPALLRSRLRNYRDPNAMMDPADEIERRLLSINLNQSLSHSQLFLTDSARFVLQHVAPHFRGETSIRQNFVSVGASLSFDLAREKRLGDMVAIIHAKRLSVLLAVLEVAWFAAVDKEQEVQSFFDVVSNVRGIVKNEYQRPSGSLAGSSVPFHQTILQIVFWCIKNSRTMLRLSKSVKAEHRLKLSETIDASMELVIEGLHVVFTRARSSSDVELDKDMELLVAVFEQCSRKDVTPSSSTWLARCEESNIIEESLELFTQADLVGLSDINLLVNRHLPLYVPHILLFHIALATVPSAAERLAGKGLLPAYSNSIISPALSSGLVDVTIPELSGHRSPAHYVYCSMLSIVSTVMTSIARENTYFTVEVCGLVQLYSNQISRATSWTVGDPISLALLEELEQVVHLFFAVAESGPSAARRDPMVEKNLRNFTPHALHLLQQVNYAITHPHQLVSLFEPINEGEEVLLNGKGPNDDPLKRPLVAHLLHRLYRLSSNLLFTLISISKAFTVLLGDEDDWPVQEATVLPHSKVVLEEPASLGTLLELGNSTLDVLKDLVNLPAGQSLVVAGPALASRFATALNVKQGVMTARRNLESVLVYSTTQLAVCLIKSNSDLSGNEMDADDMDIGKTEVVKERRAPRGSLSLADRLRRGMTSEMAADLRTLLEKAKPVIKKSDGVLGPGAVDLMDVLSTFVRDRISAPP